MNFHLLRIAFAVSASLRKLVMLKKPLAAAALVTGLGISPMTLPLSAQTAPAGTWLAEDILGGGVIDRLQTTLEFTDDGRIAGTGGCNHYFGAVKIEGDRVSFGQIGSTQMACSPAVMGQEAKFFGALAAARVWRVETATQKLLLLDEKGSVALRLARMR